MNYLKRELFNIFKAHKLFFVSIIFITFINSVITVFIPLLLKRHITLLEFNPKIKLILFSILLYTLFLIISNIFSILWHYLTTKFGANILFDLRKKMLTILYSSYYTDLSKIGYDRLKHIIYYDTLTTFRVIVNFTIQIITKSLIIIFIFILIFYSFCYIGFFLIITFFIGLFIANISRKQIAKFSKDVNNTMKSTYSYFNYAIDSIKLAQTNNLTGYFLKKNDNVNKAFISAALKADINQVFFKNLQSGLKTFFNILLITFLYINNRGKILTGDVILLIFYSNLIWQYTKDIEQLIATIGQSMPAFENIEKILTFPIKTGKIKIANINSIRFDNVTFFYNDKPVLNKLNLSLKKGDRVKLTGINGAGKSTFVSLLMNFNKPNSGTIFINEIPLNKLDYNVYVDKILFIDQNELLLPELVTDYLKIISKEKSSDKIKHLLKEWFSENIENYALNYNGNNLSGGEIKKLFILKLLLKFKEADLIIIDEITANLDKKSKEKYFQIRDELLKNSQKIIIEISHYDQDNNFFIKFIDL